MPAERIPWAENTVVFHRGVTIAAVTMENRRRCWGYRMPGEWRLFQEHCSAEDAMRDIDRELGVDSSN